MSARDFVALAPLLCLAAAALLVMLTAAFHRSHALAAALSGAGLAAALAAVPFAQQAGPIEVTALLIVDGFALFYIALLCAAALAVVLLAYGYLHPRQGQHEELYVLLLTATLGAAVLAASSHLVSFFIGLELLSVSLFVLVGYPVTQRRPLEAAVKYLVLSAIASALLIFGIALIYYETGALQFAAVGAAAVAPAHTAVLTAGFALVLAAVGFKLSLVPFHLWAPDVYEGAPAPVSGFLATVSKTAVAALLLRYLGEARAYDHPSIIAALVAVSVVSILAGNLLALLQNNLKRILAYSSIAHLGYLLITFVAADGLGREAASYYLAAYTVMTLGAFGVVSRLSAEVRGADLGSLKAYRGLFWRHPWLAAVLTVMLLSLAGIPLTVGFVAKFYVFAAGIATAQWGLVAVLVIGSVIGLFYYLRVIGALFARMEPMPALPMGHAAAASDLALCLLTVLLIALGVYPQPAMDLIRLAVAASP